MHQSLLEACPWLFACGLMVEDHLELVSLKRSRIILLLLRNKLCLGVLIFFQRDTSSRWPSTTRPQAKSQGQASRGDWCIWGSSQSLGQVGSQDYIKFYFIEYNYNSKDCHQDDVDPEEEELESSWGWLRQHSSLISLWRGQVQSTSTSCTSSRSHKPSCW